MAPPRDGAQGVVTTTLPCAGHTIAHRLFADRPGTITYHEGHGCGGGAGLVGLQGIVAGGRAKTDAPAPRHHGKASHGGAGHDLVAVLRTDGGSATGGRTRIDRSGHDPFKMPWKNAGLAAGRPARISVPLPWWYARWGMGMGMASVEAQIMADCPVIYYDEEEYNDDPPVQRLLRWSAATLAGMCGRRDPDIRRRQDNGPLNVRVGGRVNPHVSRAPPYLPPP